MDLGHPNVIFRLMAYAWSSDRLCAVQPSVRFLFTVLAWVLGWACAYVEPGSPDSGVEKQGQGVGRGGSLNTFFCVSPGDRTVCSGTTSSPRKTGFLSSSQSRVVSLSPNFSPGPTSSQDDWQW